MEYFSFKILIKLSLWQKDNLVGYKQISCVDSDWRVRERLVAAKKQPNISVNDTFEAVICGVFGK